MKTMLTIARQAARWAMRNPVEAALAVGVMVPLCTVGWLPWLWMDLTDRVLTKLGM